MTTTVEAVLGASRRMMTVTELRTETGLPEADIRTQLKTLANAGNIEHIPGRGRYDGRYGLNKLPGATPKTQPEVVKNTGSKDSVCHSEGQAVANKTPGPDAGTPPSKAEGAGGDDSNKQELLSILYDIRQAIGDKDGKLMLGDLAGQIKGICEIGEAHRRDCDLWEKSMKSAIGEDYVIGVGIAIEKLKSELATERQAREALQEQINAYDELNHGHHYYFVIAPKRPIKMFKKLKNAREASKTAIRAGAAFAEVVPGLKAIGRAMRGAEWRGA